MLAKKTKTTEKKIVTHVSEAKKRMVTDLAKNIKENTSCINRWRFICII